MIPEQLPQFNSQFMFQHDFSSNSTVVLKYLRIKPFCTQLFSSLSKFDHVDSVVSFLNKISR
jgi:hypothetical protein